MERPPKRSASGRGFGFDGPEVIRTRLNQTLTRPSDWVHLGEIVVIHLGIRALGLGGSLAVSPWIWRRGPRGDAPASRFWRSLAVSRTRRYKPGNSEPPFSLQGQDHGHRTHLLDHQARRHRA